MEFAEDGADGRLSPPAISPYIRLADRKTGYGDKRISE